MERKWSKSFIIIFTTLLILCVIVAALIVYSLTVNLDDVTDVIEKHAEGLSDWYEEAKEDSPIGSASSYNRIDMTGKLMYPTKDGANKDTDSFWVFEDSSKACLWNSKADNSYFHCNYEVYYGQDAANYIAYELPEYGVTLEEQTTFLNMVNEDDYYEEYVCIVFRNCIFIDENGEDKSYYDMAMPYFGHKCRLEDGTVLYEIAGMNSAAYYYFIEESN